MPATTRNASVQTVAKAANQSSEIQCGSIAAMAFTYSAGVANPLCAPAISGFGVRAVLRMLVLTKRMS